MKRLVLSLVATALLSLSLLSAACAQSAQRCGGADTTTYSTTPQAVFQLCNVTTGPAGILLAVASAETQCGATGHAQLWVGTGTSPVSGSNFIGQIASNVLTATNMIPAFGVEWPPFTIQTGQTLSGSGFTPVTITGFIAAFTTTISSGTYNTSTHVAAITLSAPAPFGLSPANTLPITISGTGTALDGSWTVSDVAPNGVSGSTVTFTTPTNLGSMTISGGTLVAGGNGDVGTYSVSGSPGTIASEIMYGTNAMPGGLTAITPNFSHTDCNGGFALTSIAGVFTGAPNTAYWMDVAIASSTNGVFVDWNNNGIAIFAY